MSDSNKKHFFTTIDVAEARSFFQRAAEDGKPISLWLKGQSQDDVEEYVVKTFEEGSTTISIEKSGGFFSKIGGNNLLFKEVFFKINFETINIFSYATLKKNEETGALELRALNDVYKSQKRSNYRLMAGRHVQLQFKINEVVYDALDVSAGGTSIIIDADKQDIFTKDSIHKDCKLRINRQHFDIPNVKIVGAWEQFHADGNPMNKFKLGIAFVDVPEKIEEDLFKEINSEARAEEIRKKMG